MTTPYVGAEFPRSETVDLFWVWDKLHAPRPLTPLSGDTIAQTVGEGFTIGQGEFACPLGLYFWMVNYYAYACFFPVTDLGGETMADRARRYEQNLEKLVPQVGLLWENEWLPKMKPAIERARNQDNAAFDDAALVAELDRQRAEQVERWTVHGMINFILIAAARFNDFYRDNIKPEDANEGYVALQGFVTRSLDAGRGLWRLSRIIKRSPALVKLFEEGDPKALVQSLEGSAEGRDFLTELRAYLDEFGWRSDAIYDVADITWREEPSIPLNTLQGFVRLADDADPDVLFKAAVAKRERLLAEARQKLASHPDKLATFNELYEAAWRNMQVTEDHSYWIDQLGVAVFRELCLECGRRLAGRGQIAERDDVFYLMFDELKDAIANKTDRKALTAQRRRERDQWAKVVPPLTIGPPPPESDDPFVDALMIRMLGPFMEPEREPDLLKGIPASPGVIQGKAKVVRSLSEASKLQDGDIMVCEMTVPPWTPLFSTVGGVVADTGGVLSHCAIVSREYKLPAVVGTVIGTNSIKDGWTITVDGTKGIVRIDSRT